MVKKRTKKNKQKEPIKPLIITDEETERAIEMDRQIQAYKKDMERRNEEWEKQHGSKEESVSLAEYIDDSKPNGRLFETNNPNVFIDRKEGILYALEYNPFSKIYWLNRLNNNEE